MALYRYSRWDGSQSVFSLDEDDLLEQLSDHVMAHGDLSSALRHLIQSGAKERTGQHLPGLQDLLQRLRSMRQQTLERFNLNSILGDIDKRLQDVIDTERQGIQRRLQDLASRMDMPQDSIPADTAQALSKVLEQQAQRSFEFLAQLPPGPADRLRELSQYEFMTPEAKAKFDELMKSLQQRMMDSHFQGLSQQLQSTTPQDIQSIKDMLRDLNRMLEQRLRGAEPSASDFQDFLQKHAGFFGPTPPVDLDELIERLRDSMAGMQDLLRSMSPGQRQELQRLLESTLADPELQDEMRWLGANLDALLSPSAPGREYRFQGHEDLGLEEAFSVMEHLQNIEELERQIRRAQSGAGVGDVDKDLLQELLGQDAVGQLEQLKSITHLLEEAGYIRRIGNRYELTPRGVRRIGQKALQEIFAVIRRDRSGGHQLKTAGVQGEWQREGTKKYEYGDTFDPDLHQTLINAIQRGEGIPVRLRPDDFEVYQTGQLSQAATVLMVDLSLSMAMRGSFMAAKKVALALDNLIRTQFPRDTLYVVGFSTYAREIKPEKLPYLTWDEMDPYTNIQHGLALSQRLLAKVPGNTTKQIIMVSDGEPTAHMEDGQLFLQYPPSPRTIRETLLEVKRCTTRNITINTFMLDRSAHLIEFVEQMSRINKGRVFFTSPDRLGRYILVDYFATRRRVLG